MAGAVQNDSMSKSKIPLPRNPAGRSQIKLGCLSFSRFPEPTKPPPDARGDAMGEPDCENTLG